MNISIRSGILPCMDISALNTTNDIEKLRAMALAMVQKVMSENAEKEQELQEKSRRIQLLEEMLKLVRQQRFGKKCETLAGMQRSLFEEDVDADIAGLTAHLDKLLPQSPEEDEKRPVHARYANPYRFIFHGWKKLSSRTLTIALNVTSRCTISVMR
ncbi:transposase [Escherichia coli]|nr:transposase [Escherichia coli]GDI84660.1 transposase [Escherichia coli]GDM78426.1 transposase [Escherichia coli]GDN03434.1 transposase [Escherichia coli]